MTFDVQQITPNERLLQQYQEIRDALIDEAEKLDHAINITAELVAANPATASEYYESLKILGGKRGWIQGKLAEVQYYIDEVTQK